MTEFTEQMALARTDGRLDLIEDCVGTTPAVYDGTPPNCWTECPPATRTFLTEHATNGQLTDTSGEVWWQSQLPVTYITDDAIIDVTENWSIRPTEDRYIIDDFRIETPLLERQRAVDTVNQYLDHLSNEDWTQAADLLTRTATAPFDSRSDLQELGADSYDQAVIADALASWCTDGCDTTAAAPAELDFTGGYELTRDSQTIRITWFEGTYGIYGPPIR